MEKIVISDLIIIIWMTLITFTLALNYCTEHKYVRVLDQKFSLLGIT
jgi:hypothetical protein